MKNIFEKKGVKLGCLILALAYSLSNYLWGIWIVDDFFWIYDSDFWNKSAMCALSLRCINVCCSLFGRSLISVKLLAFLLNGLTVLLPYFLLLKRKEWMERIYYLCGALVILGPGIFKCCTPDVFTSFFASILLVCCVKLLKSDKTWIYIVLASISTALVVSSRFPNILYLPLVSIFIFWTLPKNERWQKSIAYIALSVLLYYVLLYALFQNNDGINMLVNEFKTETGSANGKHSIIGLLLRYCKSILLSTLGLSLLLISWYISKLAKNEHVRNLLLIIIGTILMAGVLSHIGLGIQSWSVCIVSFDIVIMVYISYLEYIRVKNGKGEINYSKIFFFVFVSFFALVPSAGSDTGFQKSITIGCAIAPFIVIELQKVIGKRTIINSVYISVLLTSACVFNIGEFGCSIFTSNTRDNNDKALKYIFLPSGQIDNYHKYMNEIKPYYKKDHIIFYGYHEPPYLYVATGTKLLYDCGFWMERNEPMSIGRAIKAMNNDPSNVLIDYMKSDEKYFIKSGLKCIAHENNFNVYSFER